MKYVWVSICLLVVVVVGSIFVIGPENNSRNEININDIAQKVDIPNKNILIPSKYKVKNVYLHDNDFVSTWVQVIMSKKVKIYIYTSDDLKNKDSEYINKEKINNSNVKKYKTKSGKLEYVFKQNSLIYLYRFSPSEKDIIDQYLKRNLN